ncbi:MAG: hypothetical protein WAL66_17020 [Nitrososphaeraceae archaeon]
MTWESVPKNDYFSSAFSSQNRITVCWRPDLFNDTRCRKCVISSAEQFSASKLDNSFIPRYKDGKSPWDQNARIFTLSEYYPNAKIQEVNNGILAIDNESLILQVTTAHDTDSENNLIVDGLKRAFAVLNKIKYNEVFRPITILEFYGNLISKIFYADFPHILLEK